MEQSAKCKAHRGLKAQHHGEVDRISDLPDHLLLHILSLLPTCSAVATSSLSNRWKDVWTGLKTLDLTDCSEKLQCFADRNSFSKFLDKVQLGKDAPCWELVKLYIVEEMDQMHVIEWIMSSMKHGIRKLELGNEIEGEWYNESLDKLMLLPKRFYKNHDLVELKLCGDLIVSFPVSLHFPLLKKVCLYRIHYLDGESLRNLLSRCPILEELIIEYCEGEDVSLNNYGGTEVYTIHHSQSLASEEVILPRLDPGIDKELPVFSNLTHMELKMYSWSIVSYLLELCPSLKYLSVSYECIDQEEKWLCPPSVPNCMLVLEEVQILEFDGLEFVTELVQYVFMNAKLLKKMKVQVCNDLKHEIEEIIKVLKKTPKVSVACEIEVC